MKNKPTIKTPIPAASPSPNFTFACIPAHRGCSCLHPSLSRLIPRAQQINNQSSIVNNKSANRPQSRNYLIPRSPDPLQPDIPIPRSPIVSPVSRLLYSIFFVSLCLGGFGPIMQNKPNFKIGKMTLTSYYKKHYTDTSPLRRRKNKANQSQFPYRRPAPSFITTESFGIGRYIGSPLARC